MDDIAFSIAIDEHGNACVAGSTESVNFPLTANAFQSAGPSNQFDHAFVSKLNATGSALLYSSYLGGSSLDRAFGIAVDSENNIYVAGQTLSNDFPTTINRLGPGFIAKFDPTLSGAGSRIYSTRVNFVGNGVAVDRFKQAYVAGNASVEKLGDTGEEVLYSASVRFSSISDIAVDPRGTVFVTGSTNSSQFPVTAGAAQSVYRGGGDAFIAKLKATNGAILYGSFLGGLSSEIGMAIALDIEGKPYIAGSTRSSNFPTTTGAFQTSAHGDSVQGFIAKFDPPPPPLIVIPGIAGTELCDRDALIAGCIWPGYSSPLTHHTNLSLDPREEGEVPPNIIATQAIGMFAYKPLLDALQDRGGYRKYNDKQDPVLRTANGCDLTQSSNRPDLFVFPYDWRKSNVDNAILLAGYVQCVRKFYPDSEVNILAHSMGGLVASRYVLQHPTDHHINKLITVATPWLGAPKSLAILEAGKPFVSELIAASEDIKKISEFFPAVHQLIPGPAYFGLGGRPFAEDQWDYDNNGIAFEQYNQYSKLVNGLNVQHPHPASLPGSVNAAFRKTPGQEDASGDNSGIDYYSIYSNQKKLDTIGKVITIFRRPSFKERLGNRLGLTVFPLKDVSLEHTEGDGTVPLLSLRRATVVNGTPVVNLNPGWNIPDDARYFLIKPGPTDKDKIAEHVAVTAYSPVQDLILFILRDLPISLPNQNQAQNQEPSTNPALAQSDDGAPLDPLPAYYLSVRNVRDLRVTDAYGNTDAAFGPIGLRNVSDVSITPTNANSATMVMPTDQTFTVVATTNPIPMSLEIVKAKGQTATTLAVRYNDVSLPANVKVMLSVGPQGVDPLRSDNDNNGSFETILTPTTSLNGTAAEDRSAPEISFAENPSGATSTITLATVDSGSGVKSVFYCVEGFSEAGMFCDEYTGPFQVDPISTPVAFAFADDNAGNQSGLVSYRLKAGNRIAFVSGRDGNQEIYTMFANGSSPTRLTANPTTDISPAWSPDGPKIAFVTNRDGNAEIYVMNADGSGLTNLTNNAADDTNPAWSPDGTQIAFSSSRSGARQIYVMNADGSNQVRLTNNTSNDVGPTWSPDSQFIAFSSDRDGNSEIYLMKADGNQPNSSDI